MKRRGERGPAGGDPDALTSPATTPIVYSHYPSPPCFPAAGPPHRLREEFCAALGGPGDLRWRAGFGSWGGALGARDRCRDRSGQPANAPGAPYLFLGDPVHQYLLQAGRTSFGGLVFADLRRLALDIEVMTTEGHEFPSAARPGDRIIAVALADSTGFRHVVRGDRLDERALLEECSRIVRERDPDVIG